MPSLNASIKIAALLVAQIVFSRCREINTNKVETKKESMMSQQEISDRLQIQDLLVRYCYAVDDRNWDTYRNIFTRDAVITIQKPAA